MIMISKIFFSAAYCQLKQFRKINIRDAAIQKIAFNHISNFPQKTVVLSGAFGISSYHTFQKIEKFSVPTEEKLWEMDKNQLKQFLDLTLTTKVRIITEQDIRELEYDRIENREFKDWSNAQLSNIDGEISNALKCIYKLISIHNKDIPENIKVELIKKIPDTEGKRIKTIDDHCIFIPGYVNLKNLDCNQLNIEIEKLDYLRKKNWTERDLRRFKYDIFENREYADLSSEELKKLLREIDKKVSTAYLILDVLDK